MLKLLKNKSLINRNTIILFSIYSNALAIYQVFATMQTDFVRNIIDITEISQLNNVRSVFMLVLAFTAFPWAYLAEKIKRKYLLIISSLFNFLGPLLSAFCTSYSELILFQIISGIGYAGSVNLTRIMILDVVPRKESGRVYSLLTLGGILQGALCGQLIPSIMVGQSYWYFSFILVAIINLISFIFSLFIIEPKKGSQENALESVLKDDLEYSYKLNFSDLKRVLKVRSNLYLLIFYFFFNMAVGAYIFVNFPLLTEEFNLPPPLAMMFLTGSQLPILLGTIYWGPKSDEEFKKKMDGKVKIIIKTQSIFLPLMILNFIILYFAKNVFFGLLFLCCAGLLVASFFWNIPMTSVPSIFADINPPEHRGTIISISGLSLAIGQSLGIFLAGIFVTLHGTYIWGLIIIFLTAHIGILFLFSSKKIITKEVEDLTNLLEKRAEEIKNGATK